MREIKIGICQMRVVEGKANNLNKAGEMIAAAAHRGAQFVILPEMFNCPYDNGNFPVYAEAGEGDSRRMLAAAAKAHGVYLIGGSIPELDNGAIYNTCFVYRPDGSLLGMHRKAHLFDVDVPGGVCFRESAVLSAGNACTVLDTPYGKIGVAVCFDIRFAELFTRMGREGAQIIFVPGAFNMTTGPAHWELSLRMRAVDNQCFVVGCSPARDERQGYVSYANSLISDPWGTVAGRLGEREELLVAAVDLDRIAQVRRALPIGNAKRPELYGVHPKEEVAR